MKRIPSFVSLPSPVKVKATDLFWHFARNDRKLGYDDGRRIVVGKTLKVAPPIELCEHGLHASKNISDALRYAPGAYMCAVKLGGEVIHGDDKSVATERTVIAAADATHMLYRFAIDCAARAMQECGWEHQDSWNALSIRWCVLSASGRWRRRAAARAAARSVVGSAAWAAVQSAQFEELTRRALALLNLEVI